MSAEMSDQKSDPATLQVAGEEVKLSGEEEHKEVEIDMSERDPNDMNAQIKVRMPYKQL